MKKTILFFVACATQICFGQSVFPTNGANVGIGTTTPSEKLEIYNSDTTPGVLSLKSLRNDFQYVDVGRISAKQGSVEVSRIGMPRSGETDTGYFTFWTKAGNAEILTEKVRISENGNMGIGTTSPNSRLTIKSGTSGVSIHPGSGANSYFGSIAFNRESATGEIFDNRAFAFQINNGNNSYDKNLHFQIYNTDGTLITNDALVINGGTGGNIGIGTSYPDSKLAVNGTIHSKEVKVDMSGWPDYVFKKEYDLPTLEEVEKHIAEKGHLDNIPSEEDVLKNGINLGEMNAKLLQKMEEMTLYMIEQNKRMNQLEKENQNLKTRLDSIKK